MNRRPISQPDLFRPKGTSSPLAVERVQLVDLELSRVEAKDTDYAYCVRKSWLHDPVWLPRSLTELQGGVFTFPRWLAVEKGLL